jgi:hypothetical protein
LVGIIEGLLYLEEDKNIDFFWVVCLYQYRGHAEAYGGVAGRRSAKNMEKTAGEVDEAPSRNLSGETEENHGGTR